MREFLHKHEDRIHSVLSCFDRMMFRGYLPIISGWAMAQFLNILELTYRTFYRGHARGKQEGWQGNGRDQERDRDRRRIAGEKPAISVRPGRQCAACPDPRGEPQNLDATMGTAGGATGYTSRLRRPELKSKLTCQGGTYCRANAPVPGGGRGLKGSRARQRLLWRWRRMRSTMRG
jgi:hypothetical protein